MTLKIMGIYKITNTTNNKVYIGQSLDLKRRRAKHIQSLKNNNHTNKHLQLAFNEYGEDNFKFEIIEELTDISQLDKNETYWINYYKSYNRECGYNIELGGVKNKHFIPLETREKMRIAKLGVKRSPEVVKAMKQKKVPQEVKMQISKTMREKGINIGESNPRFGKPSTQFGKTLSKETRKKISNSKSGQCEGENNPFWGKKHKPETLKKISESRKGKRKGIKHSPETLEKMRQKRKEYWAKKKMEKGSE